MISERLHMGKERDRRTRHATGRRILLLTMLHIILVFPLCAQSSFGKNQVFIYGQVTNNVNGAPVKNHEVNILGDTIYNPLFHYYKSLITDSEGFFYDTIYTEINKGSIYLFTYDIDNSYHDTTVYFRFEWSETNSLLVNFIIADSLPQVSYQADFKVQRDTTGITPLKMHFKDCSNATNIISWNWDFGDGTTSSLQNPEHTYAEPGIYLVTLAIKGMFSSSGEILESSIVKIIRVFFKGYYHLGGQVFAGYFPIDMGIAYLYQITPANEINFIDSVAFDTLGCYYFYQLIEGKYMVKADLHPDSYLLQSFIATYYGNTLFWKEADTIEHKYSNFNYDVQLRPCTQMSAGIGEIGGSIIYSNEVGSKNAPASNVQVLLLDAYGNPITGRHSSSSGAFKFSSLSLNTYLVHADVTGKNTEPIEVTLTPEKYNFDNISITISSNSVQGSIPYGIEENLSPAARINIFPNPASEYISISVDNDRESAGMIRIYNAGMQKTMEEKILFRPGSDTRIDVTTLPPGVYFLLFEVEGSQNVLQKFVVEN